MGFGPNLYAMRSYGASEYSQDPSLAALLDSISSGDVSAVSLASAMADSVSSSGSLLRALLNFLSDSMTASESAELALLISLADASGGADALAADLAGAFSDALTLSASEVPALAKGMLDALGISDAIGQRLQQIPLSDFILLKEFISAKLRRSTLWTQGGTTHRGIVPHAYGNVLYAKNMYSTNIAILWDALQKSKGPGFTNEDGHKN